VDTDDGLLLIVPPGAEVWGRLPPPDLPHERARLLERNPVRIILPNAYMITIRWLPNGYRCHLAVLHDENHPLEEAAVAAVADVRRWLEETIARL
jgi:hypothetical protein